MRSLRFIGKLEYVLIFYLFPSQVSNPPISLFLKVPFPLPLPSLTTYLLVWTFVNNVPMLHGL